VDCSASEELSENGDEGFFSERMPFASPNPHSKH